VPHPLSVTSRALSSSCSATTLPPTAASGSSAESAPPPSNLSSDSATSSACSSSLLLPLALRLARERRAVDALLPGNHAAPAAKVPEVRKRRPSERVIRCTCATLDSRSGSAIIADFPERWMSGLSRTPGKRVWVNSPSGVRIPLSPPEYYPKQSKAVQLDGFFASNPLFFLTFPMATRPQ
jgi:hypothetical protein